MLRKILLILNTPTLKNIYDNEKCVLCDKVSSSEEHFCINCDGFRTVLQRSIYHKDHDIRDLFLKICLQCPDFDISQFVTSQKDMQ